MKTGRLPALPRILLTPVFGYCSRLAQTVTDFADASHSKSAKSSTTTVLYGIFSSENSYPCTVTGICPCKFSLLFYHTFCYNAVVVGKIQRDSNEKISKEDERL